MKSVRRKVVSFVTPILHHIHTMLAHWGMISSSTAQFIHAD